MMNKTEPAKTVTMADCDFEFAKGSTQPKVCEPFAPEALRTVLSQILAIVGLIVVVGHSYPARAANCLNGH